MNVTPISAQPQKKIESRPKRLAALPDPHNWCVEINTDFPIGRYNFGPFDSRQAAEASRSGHVDALCRQAARGIVGRVRHYQPDGANLPVGGEMPLSTQPDCEHGACPQKWF
jgi:hypothetical protein